jgi:hypothetical protein
MTAEAGAEAAGFDQAMIAELETFEGFKYTVKVGNKTPDDKYHVSVHVEGDFVRERTPAADEKEEDKERLDKEFNEKLAKLEEKLAQEKTRADWIYLVSKWTVDPLLKVRADFLEAKTDESQTEDDAPEPADVDEDEHESDEPPLVPELFKSPDSVNDSE